MKTNEITKEEWIEYGMKETGDQLVPMKKIIGMTEDADDELSIALTGYSGAGIIPALIMPGGNMIHLANIRTIDDIKTFEKFIGIYDPNY